MRDPGSPPDGNDSGPGDARERRFDWREAESLPAAVARAVAAVEDAPVVATEPLYEHVDPDALDALFAPASGGSTRATGQVRFPFHGHEVVVRADGELVVRSPADGEDGGDGTDGAGGRDGGGA